MAQNISRSLLKNDVKRNPLVNAMLFLFLMLSALLMSTGVLVSERLSGSLDELMEAAHPPHFLQMHVGEINKDSLNAFVADSNAVQAMQIQPMVQIDGVRITFNRADGSSGSMGDSMIDNYFVMQNSSFDYLLDKNRKIVSVHAGEIGVPITYLKKYDLQIGDSLVVRQDDGSSMPFIIKEAILDAQMGSSLSSSLRFLVAAEDFHTLEKKNSKQESIISFLLRNPRDAIHFQERYSAAGEAVPQNGQAVTIELINLVNIIGDGVMCALLILLAVVLTLVALLNVRFTLYATLEEEVCEIGMLRAIGLSKRDIKHLYMQKYIILSAAASIFGALLAFPLAQLFTDHIATHFGSAAIDGFTVASPFIAAFLMFLFVLFFLHGMLRKLSELTILDALGEENFTNTERNRRRFRKKKPTLSGKSKHIVFALAICEFRENSRAWFLPIIVFCLMSFIILVPLNLYTTFSSPDFIRYMGAAPCDVRIDIGQSADTASSQELKQMLQSSSQVLLHHDVMTTEVDAETKNGRTGFYIESGEYDDFPIDLSEGKLPQGDNELILSVLNAERFEKEVGDPMVLFIDGKRVPFTITGIYQDITNGGFTAKTSRQDIGSRLVRETYYINLAEGADASVFSKKLTQALPEIKVIPMDAFIDQTLGTITASLRTVVVAVVGFAALTAFMIMTFFITLQTQRNVTRDVALRAIGFRLKAVRSIYLLQGALATVIGVAMGVGFSMTIGQFLAGKIFSLLGFGISGFTFSFDLFQAGTFGILLPMATGVIACLLVAIRVKDATVTRLRSI